MTPQNLIDYIRVYENHIPQDICQKAVENLDKSSWREHAFYDAATGQHTSYDHELAISYDEIPEKEFISKQIWFALERYIVKDFVGFHEWFNGWNGYAGVRFNRYDPTTQMKLHCDHIHSMFDGQRKGIPVLTVLGALNDNYEGGEFVMFGDLEIKLPAGAVIVFPSNFMYPHEVKPVKKGVRYTYVSWAW